MLTHLGLFSSTVAINTVLPLHASTFLVELAGRAAVSHDQVLSVFDDRIHVTIKRKPQLVKIFVFEYLSHGNRYSLSNRGPDF